MPIHVASQCGHLAVCEWLMSQGADIHVKCLNGKTPLHYASQEGHQNVSDWLKQQGAQ